MKKLNKELYRTPFSNGKKWFLISMISMVILSAYNLIISWLLQKIIDLTAGIDKTPFYQLALVSLVSFLVFIVFYFIFRYAHPKFLQTLSTSYKDLLFSKILRNNSSLVSEIGSGQVLSKLSNDLKSIEENYFDFYITLIDIGISFIGAIILINALVQPCTYHGGYRFIYIATTRVYSGIKRNHKNGKKSFQGKCRFYGIYERYSVRLFRNQKLSC